MNQMLQIILTMLLLVRGSRAFTSDPHSIFLSPSDDPFLDPFIETILHMDTDDILAIPKVNDSVFINYMLKNDDQSFGISVRTDTSVFDSLRDTQLMRQTEIDKEWETLMVAGPIVVGYMGNLMVLSSKRDFPFQAPENYVYRYIRFPNSFRATLAQLSSDMYDALMNAHTSMDKVQLAIKQVPNHVKTAMKLISSGSDNMLKSMLPLTLNSISRLATDSADIANSTLKRFNQVGNLLAEIIELSASTQSGNEAVIVSLEEKRNSSALEQAKLQMKLQQIQEEFKRAKIELENARKQYQEAMDNLTGASSVPLVTKEPVIFSIIGDVINAVINPLRGFACLFLLCNPTGYPVDNSKFENALKLAQIAREDLEKAQKAYDKHFQAQLEEQNELAKVINGMAMLDLSKLSMNEVIDLLLQATMQIESIKEQWSRLVQFFSKLAAQAQSTQQVVVEEFVKVIQQAQKDNILVDPIDREFFIELLVPAASSIENGAHLLFVMASTYYGISRDHMINQIAGISKLLLLQTDDARNAHLQKASNDTLSVSMKISDMVQARHTAYIEETQNRQAQYTAYINDLMIMELEETIG